MLSACCSSCELKTNVRTEFSGLAGFTEDGTAAIAASPNYFLAWYSVKSILLVGVAAALAYQLGKAAR